MHPSRLRAATLLVAVVSVNASYTVLIPFIGELGTRAHAGPAVIAGTFALFAAAKTLAQPVGGWWVDRWRPGAVACCSLTVCGVGTVITALARDPVTLLTGRVVWGVGEGLVCPALYAGMSALCARYDIPTSRMMGNFGSAAVAGFLLGPLAAGVAAPLGIEALFIAGAVLTVVTGFGLLYAIPHSRAREEVGGTVSAAAPVGAAPVGAGPDSLPEVVPPQPERWWAMIVALGVLDMSTFLVYAALEPVLPLYLGATHTGSAREAISVVFTIGLAASGICVWALGRWTGAIRLPVLVAAGLALVSIGLPGLAISPDPLPVSAWFVVYTAGYSVLFLAARRGVLELREAAVHQGKAFGLFGMVSDVGNIIGPALGVLLWHVTGRGVFVLLGLGTSLMLLAVVGGVLARGRRRTAPGTRPSPEGREAAPLADPRPVPS